LLYILGFPLEKLMEALCFTSSKVAFIKIDIQTYQKLL